MASPHAALKVTSVKRLQLYAYATCISAKHEIISFGSIESIKMTCVAGCSGKDTTPWNAHNFARMQHAHSRSRNSCSIELMKNAHPLIWTYSWRNDDENVNREFYNWRPKISLKRKGIHKGSTRKINQPRGDFMQLWNIKLLLVNFLWTKRWRLRWGQKSCT